MPNSIYPVVLGFRISLDLRDGLRSVAAREHESMAAICRLALKEYVRSHQERHPAPRSAPGGRFVVSGEARR